MRTALRATVAANDRIHADKQPCNREKEPGDSVLPNEIRFFFLDLPDIL